jgi:chromosome segregation ATPase
MTGEEMERAIAFIIEQQAQFAANQQRHEELLLKHGETVHNHEEFMRDHEEARRNHEETLHRIEGTQEQTALQIQHLGRAMVELTEAHTRTENTLAELTEAHTRTENTLADTNDKLNALIDTVERHISEGRNGKA